MQSPSNPVWDTRKSTKHTPALTIRCFKPLHCSTLTVQERLVMARIFIRRGVFYCRVHVPIALRATLNGRSQLWKSLRTRSRVVADIQAARWEGRVVRLFPYLMKFAPSMTSEQIQWLVAEYVNATLDTVEEFSLTQSRTDSEREAASLAITDQLDDSTADLLNNDFHRVATTANDLLTKHGLTVERDSLDWKRLCRGLLGTTDGAPGRTTQR